MTNLRYQSVIIPWIIFLAISLVSIKKGIAQTFNVPDGIAFYADVPYAQGNKAWMVDIAVPANATGSLPVIVAVHGGGWRSGDKNGQRGLICRFAQNGYVGVAVRYRLTGEAPFPACVNDVKSAVRWLRANAQKYHIDPNRIGAMGHSAGAHLVAMLGLAPNDAGLDVGENLGYSSVVNAVCGIATPCDFINWNSDKGESSGPVGLLAGPGESLEERAKKASPISYVHKDAPPFLLIHGTKDGTVPIAQVQRFAHQLREAGAENVHLIMLDNLGHDLYFSHEALLWPMILSFFNGTIGNESGSLIEQIKLAETYKANARKPGGFTFRDVEKYDLNKDGKISRDEFGGTDEMFSRIDRGRDNFISPEDFESK